MPWARWGPSGAHSVEKTSQATQKLSSIGYRNHRKRKDRVPFDLFLIFESMFRCWVRFGVLAFQEGFEYVDICWSWRDLHNPFVVLSI